MKSTAIINEIYQVAFAQRKFIRKSALKELTISFGNEVWLMIIISLFILSSILSLKYYLLSKKGFWHTFDSTLFQLISAFLLNNSGENYNFSTN